MKYIAYLLTILSINVCIGQPKKNKMMNNTTNSKISPFNTFEDGGMNIDFEKFISENKEKIKSAVHKNGYKIPDKDTFYKKIEFYYNWDITNYSNVIVLENSIFPVIAIKDCNLLYIENDNGEEIDGQLISYYNNFIFYDDKPSFNWLKFQYPYLFHNLVETHGFTKNDEILKFVFERIDLENKSKITELIFQNNIGTIRLREDMVQKIRELKFKNAISHSHDDVVGRNFYIIFSDVIEDIRKQPNNYENSDYQIAFLLNEIILSGITGSADYDLAKNPNYQKTLVRNDYFNFKTLNEYVTNVYGKKPDSTTLEFTYSIQDTDGYTNLRKGKNTSSEILQRIISGSEIEVLDKSGDWWLIETTEGKRGYVHKTRIKVE